MGLNSISYDEPPHNRNRNPKPMLS